MADVPRGFGEQLFQRLQGKGLSRAQIYKALAMQRLSEEVMALGTDGKLQEAALVEISKINSAARQKQLGEMSVANQLNNAWVKELARLIRNAEKTANDKEANKYWDFFFDVKDALEREGATKTLFDRLKNFSVEKIEVADEGDRTIVDFRKYDLVLGRGLDVGTSNIVASARTTDGKTLYNIARNAFLDVRNDTFTKKMLMKLGVEHIVQGDKGYVIGDHAFELANIFEKNTRRPMKDGMISPVEKEALLIVSLIIGQLLGPPKEPREVCSFSVPADPIDADRNVIYHRGALEEVLRKLGYDPKPMVEGHAVVLGSLQEEDYSGVGISCGAGMFNVCIAYKSVAAVAFSTSRGGDWIDNNVATALSLPGSQVCAVKESGVDLNRPRDRVEDAIVIYYRELIHYSLETIRQQFDQASNMPHFPDPINIVCAGGTALIKGFIDVFREEFRKVSFPIDVKEIRLANDALRTVALGCLVDAMEETKARSKVEEREGPSKMARAEPSKVVEKGTRRVIRGEPIAILQAPAAAPPPPRPAPRPEPEPEPQPVIVAEPVRVLPDSRKPEQQLVIRPAVKLPRPEAAPVAAAPAPPAARAEPSSFPRPGPTPPTATPRTETRMFTRSAPPPAGAPSAPAAKSETRSFQRPAPIRPISASTRPPDAAHPAPAAPAKPPPQAAPPRAPGKSSVSDEVDDVLDRVLGPDDELEVAEFGMEKPGQGKPAPPQKKPGKKDEEDFPLISE